MQKNQYKRILVSIPSLTFHHRLGLLGILKYIQEEKAKSWEIFIETELSTEQGLLNLNYLKYDGIIGYITNDKIRKWILSTRTPAVLYDPSISFKQSPQGMASSKIITYRDYITEGRIAAKYFIERRYKHFAYVGLFNISTHYDDQRRCGFVDELKKNGLLCHIYPIVNKYSISQTLNDRNNLAHWLNHLPHNCAVFAPCDSRAIDVIAAAKLKGIAIPEHISVLGFDNDELICETSTPKLSSISVDISSVCYGYAKLLDHLIEGKYEEDLLIESPNISVITRASTDLEAIQDPFVSKAVNWIRKNIDTNPKISAVSSEMKYPLKMLQKKFKAALGCTIGDEIIRQKTIRALNELMLTHKDTSQIAYECGFSNASHLCLHIKKLTGKTPRQIRSYQGLNTSF